MTIVNECTCIGSLPHHNIDAALEFAFKASLPFLPQIPIRNPWEYMIPQALEGMPGLEVDSSGGVALDLPLWTSRARAFDEKLAQAFNDTKNLLAFEAFEPSAPSSSSWRPFLFELQERGIKRAKIQIAGPVTCQWSLRLKSGEPIDKHPEIASQIYRLVLARAVAMCRKLKSMGVEPVVYLDEPALFALAPSNPRHMLAMQELRLMIQALKNEKGHERVTVGVHCCSNTDWASLIKTGPDILSIDAGHSLENLLEAQDDFRNTLERFIDGGGRLSLGVIPTAGKQQIPLGSLNAKALHEHLVSMLSEKLGQDEEGRSLMQRILSEAIYTPACGLALHSIPEAEQILSYLLEFQSISTQQ
jgi:hypothetical protein